MARWKVGLLALATLAAVSAGLWYLQTPLPVDEKRQGKEIEAFLSNDPQLVLRINHTRDAIQRLRDVEIVKRFKQSRFQSAFKKRIKPLFSLLTDQYKANSPYPSPQVLRYFRNSASYLLQARHHQPVMIFTPPATDQEPSKPLRDLIKEWLISPAQSRDDWSVKEKSFRETSIWNIKYQTPRYGVTVGFAMATVDNFGLFSTRPEALKHRIKRYHSTQSTGYELDMDRSNLVDFLVTNDSPPRNQPLLSARKGTIESGSIRSLQGSVTVSKPFLKLTARAMLPDSIPVQNARSPGELLEYFPANSYAVNVVSIPSLPEETSTEYRKFLKQSGHSMLPVRTELNEVLRSLEALELLSTKTLLASASFTKSVTERKTPKSTFLLALRPDQTSVFKKELKRFYENDTGNRNGYRRLSLGPMSVYGRWHDGVFLVAASAPEIRDAIRRNKNQANFKDGSGYREIQSTLPATYTSFSYFTTSPLARVLGKNSEIKNPQYKLAKSFLGFDPVREVSTLVEDAPANVFVTRYHPDSNNLTLQFYTAGDVFLPLALNQINGGASFQNEFLPDSYTALAN
ncbi:MAG: hypothetical protein ABEK50_01150 [bacterium]